MNEETLLEGLYNSMCDMAHVIAEAFGLTEATAAARRKAQGQLSPAAAKEAGVMAANVPGGQRAVAQQYRQQGINPDDAKNFAKNRAQSARNARKPGMSPTSQASSQELAQGMRRRTDGNLPTTLKTNDKFVLRASADTYRARKLRGEKNPPKPVILKRTPQ